MRPLALALALALALVGCVSSDDAGAPAAVQQAVDAVAGPDAASRLGAIEGLVVTPSLSPLVGARVTLLRENVSARTDATGLFRFADLAPGAYLVAAEADGHKARTVTTQAANGSVTRLDLTLEPDPKPEPFVETRELKGFLACAAVVQSPLREERTDCAAADPNHRDRFEFHLGPRGKATVVELQWSPADNPGVKDLRLIVETVGYGANDVELGNATGEGYARVEVPAAVMDKFYPEGGAMRAIVSLVNDGATPQAAFQTAFTVYASTFYVAPGPEGFSVIQGGT